MRLSRPHELCWRGVDRRQEALLIRQAGPRDVNRYLEHMGRIVTETPYMLQSADDPLPSPTEQGAMFAHLQRLPNSLCLIAVRGGWSANRHRILASLTLLGGQSSRTRHVCHLGMGVLRDVWNQGIGSKILDLGLQWARSNAVLTRVSLQVYESNQQALNLYLSRGFAHEGALRKEVSRVSGAYEDLLGMGLSVDHT